MIAFIISLSTISFSQVLIDRVIVVVNDKPITQSLFENELIFLEIKTVTPKVREEILRDLIDQKLMLREAERSGILLARWKPKVDAEIDRIRSKYANPNQFESDLLKSGLELKDLEERIRIRLILEEFTARRFGRADDLDQKAFEYFEQNREAFVDANGEPLDFSEVDDQIQTLIIQKQIDIELSSWLKEQRSNALIFRFDR